MLPDDRARLTHIEEAIVAAMKFIDGRSRSELGTDLMLQFALVQAVQSLARQRGMSAPARWQSHRISLAGYRRHAQSAHPLIHAYFDINLDILWTTVTEALPELLPQITRLRERLEG